MIRVLITGINGYIGSRITECLLDNGFDVVGIDLNDSQVENFVKTKRLKFFRSDITNIQSFDDSIKDIDILVHCAALVHKRSKDLSKKNYFRINYEGTKNIVSFINKKRIKQIIFFSTISVYGSVIQGIIPNEETTSEPVDFYGESKLKAEDFLKEFNRDYRVPYTIFRLVPVYGEEFLLNVNKRIYLPKRIAFYKMSNGEQLISLCSVKNIIDVIMDALNNKQYFNHIFILKDKKNYSINEIIEIFRGKYSETKKPIIRIPNFLPQMFFKLLEIFSSKKGKTFRFHLNKIIQNSIYSGEKINSIGLDLKWDIRNTI